MRLWRVIGRAEMAPPAADWRETLARRLGQRPRRLGAWAELALFGALACLDEAGEAALPAGALLSVSSVDGPKRALDDALSSLGNELPMPIGFLQSQPSQLLPVLARHLGWSGNGRVLNTRRPQDALRVALSEADPRDGVLIGWVEDDFCRWLRVVGASGPLPESTGDFPALFARAGRCFGFDEAAHLRIET